MPTPKANKAISLGISAIIVIALILILGFGVYLNDTFNTTSTTSSSSVTVFECCASTVTTSSSSSSSLDTSLTTTASKIGNYPTSAETTNSTLGLELGLSLNTTILLAGNSLNITVTILNVLPNVNNVSAESDWAVPVLANFSATTFVCPRWENFLIFNGYYSLSNISSGIPASLVPPGQAPSCPFLNRSTYSFLPQSLNASVSGGPYDYNLTTKALVEGYYTTAQGYVLSNKNLPPPPFASGTYTIVAGDEWGQVVLLHFVVSSTHSVATTTTTDTSSTTNDTIITSSTTSSSSLCTENGVGTISLTVLNASSDESIVGFPVQVMSTMCGSPVNSTLVTDSYGMVSAIGYGMYHFSVSYDGTIFNASATLGPMSLTCVTLYLPSGQTTETSQTLSQNGC